MVTAMDTMGQLEYLENLGKKEKEEKKVDLLSSAAGKGKVVDKIITFVGGTKKTFRGVKTKTIEQGQFTHFDLKDGRHIMINDSNVLYVEVFECQNAE